MDGIPLSGFADGDFLTVKVDGGGATRTLGGDGPGMNVTTPQGGTITIKLLPTSPAIGPLYELRKTQQSIPRLISLTIISGVLELVRANNCAMGDLAAFQTGGDKMTGRDFSFECLDIQLDPSVTIPMSMTGV